MPPINQPGDKSAGTGPEPKTARVERVAPVIVNLGKAKKKRIKQLKKGDGKLMREVAEALLKVEQDMSAQLAGKTVVPIIVVVERKPDDMNWGWWPMR
jgi:hypothetical protein